MNIPRAVSRSFNRKLLDFHWLTDEQITEIKKIVGFSRLGLKKFPREPQMMRTIRNIQKMMPSQGGNVLRMRRFTGTCGCSEKY